MASAVPELSGTIAAAPFSDVSAKATAFGMLIGNPIVPTLLLASAQNSVVSTYGRFRTDAPLCMASYQIAPDRSEEVVVFPSVDRIARMALDNPGSERIGEDVLHIVPNDRRPHERYAVFSKDGQFAAFASSPDMARRALVDCLSRADKPGSLPLLRIQLYRPGVKTVCQAAGKFGVTNLVEVVGGFDRLSLDLDLTSRGLVLAFDGRHGQPGHAAELSSRMETALRDTFKGFGSEDAKTVPSFVVSPGTNDVVSGEICISEAQLKSMGRDFNSLVAAQMSKALSDDAGDKGKKGKKNLRQKGKNK